MKRIIFVLITIAFVLMTAKSFPAFAKVNEDLAHHSNHDDKQCVKGWNLTGTHVVDYVWNGGDYYNDLTLTQIGGTITGTMNYPSGGSYSVLGTVNGTVTGNTVTFAVQYNDRPYLRTDTGTIAADGTISGLWNDANPANDNGTWKMTTGKAAQVFGKCEDKDKSNENRDDKKCVKGWDVTGTWNFDNDSTKWPGTYSKTMTISQDSSGNITGSGNNVPAGNTWNVSGNVSGNNITLSLTYNAPMAGYIASFVGTIDTNGVHGSWSDTQYGDSGTWKSTTGKAVQVFGKCEDKDKDKSHENNDHEKDGHQKPR